MKSFVLAALGFVKIASAAQSFFEQIVGVNVNLDEETDVSSLPLSHQFQKNGFGYLVEETVYSNSYREKKIKSPLIPFHMDFTQQEQFINRLTSFH